MLGPDGPPWVLRLGKDAFDLDVRSWNHVDRDQLPDSSRGRGAGVSRRLDRTHVPADEHRHVACPYVLLGDEHDIGRLDHRIGGLDGADQTSRFNHSECVGCHAVEIVSFHPEMPRDSASFTLILVILSTGCARSPVDDAKGVASAAVSVDPSVVSSGMPVELDVKFEIAPDAPPFQEDYTVFVHVVDDDGQMIGAADHLPPRPTREWEAGSTVQYKHSVYAPISDYTGQATFVVGLYSPATGERVPLSGELAERRAVKAGSFEMRERTEPYVVIFREGWHSAEAPRGSGLEWRWSMKLGRLTFANPKRDIELTLELDQPNKVFPMPQHVEIRLGDMVVDDFDLEPGPSLVRRITLAQSQLGDGPDVEMAVVSDKTFVPAKSAGLQSSDTRQLGVRVFRAFVQPKQ
jgi:hypothetical protein